MTAATTLHPVSVLDRTCPIDLHPLPPVPRASEDEVRRAVARARDAQPAWHERSFDDRAASLVRAAKSMLRRRDEGMTLAHDEVGKLDVTSLFDEGIGHLDVLKQWIGVVRPALQRERVRMNPLVFPKKHSFIELLPRGVIGVIAPWNFPIAGLYRAIYPALLCGNGVVVKPSEYSPLTTQWLVESLAHELPAGLISCVHGDAAQGAMLIDAGIDACVFTGSPRSGRAVGVRCAERGIPASIEMGGKDCAIVLADCDRERTLAGITHWTLANAGQACGAIVGKDRREVRVLAVEIHEVGREAALLEEEAGPGEVRDPRGAACSAHVSFLLNHWPKGPSVRPGALPTSGWWADSWMTMRLIPFRNSASAVGLSVAGDQAHGSPDAVIDSAAARFWP